MSYFCKGKDVDLDERDQDCTHQVCDLVIISGLSHLNARVTGKKDFPGDPYTKAVKRNCPKCGFYLREFLMNLMEKSGFIPVTDRFFCSICLASRKVCQAGHGKIPAMCGRC